MKKFTAKEVLQFARENDVKFIRLAFCDVFGRLKNIAVLADELPRALEAGISFDPSVIAGFSTFEESELFLFPIPSTLVVLPWRPQQGRVIRFFCEVRYPDGRPFEGDGRYLLKQAAERAAGQDLSCKVGPKCEFYLFETDEKGYPTNIPHDCAGYMDVAPLDRGENVRRDICLTLEEMDIQPESSHHEEGPGQNEIDFRYCDALDAADNLITLRTVVEAVASRNGLCASFMPLPLDGQPGNGLHVNMSLFREGLNLFKVGGEEHSALAESFIAGIFNRIGEITAFLNPQESSYARFGKFGAPRQITWSHRNNDPLIRIPAVHNGENARMELRSPDSSVNPYIAFALLVHAGLDGIERGETLPAQDGCPAADSGEAVLGALPATREEAQKCAAQSDFVRRWVPRRILDAYCGASVPK
ncbi:MAG: glutamine synthetase family protein [Eubacteriales bacterium]|nr:glutamine synthetase family protein [Eubacteriales bacterium]